METVLESELAWVTRHMPLTRRALSALPDLSHARLACSIHLEIKMVPFITELLARGAQVFLTTCNPSTVRDQVVGYLRAQGAVARAWQDMPSVAYQQAIMDAIAWGPTHLCEFGADLTTALLQLPESDPPVQASLEGTGSGIARLENLALRYPIFNWDDLPVKESLHNRHMVGITTWQTFFARTRLTLHGKRVAVIGYGSVGQGVAATARAYGGAVSVVERDPVRVLQAAYDGWPVESLEEALSRADVIVTATGAAGILSAKHFAMLKDGAFLLNVGHRADEIDAQALLAYPHATVLPFIEEVQLSGRSVFLIAGGAMMNLTAGEGDSLNAFDLTLAVMAAGIGYMVQEAAYRPPGVYLLPRSAWEAALKMPD